jgi:hypothetical protein
MANKRTATVPDSNPWKLAALGMGGVLALIIVAGVVGAAYRNAPAAPAEKAVPAPAHRVAQAAHPLAGARLAATGPTTADIEQCNREASAAHGSRTKDTITDALIGGAGGAALGAAGGAIAGGGKGAGKGAGIGGLVGAAAGTLYGLNKSNESDTGSTEAYRACMARKGF